MSLPSVSVVIPTRDRPELLRKTLRAVAAQTYEGEVEAIVVFDQTSIDASITDDIDDLAIRTIENDRSPGLAGARNAGAMASRADVIAFCDDDDEWYPHKLRRQIEMMTDGGYGVVAGGIDVDFQGNLNARIPDKSEITYDDLLRDRVFAAHPSTVIVDRALMLGTIGLVDEEIPGSYGEDYEWILRAAAQGPVGVVTEPVARVLWGSASFFAERWKTRIAALEYLLDKHPEFEREPVGLARIEGQIAFARASLGDRRGARREARRALRHHWSERRAYLALLVSTGLVKSESIVAAAQRRGRGI